MRKKSKTQVVSCQVYEAIRLLIDHEVSDKREVALEFWHIIKFLGFPSINRKAAGKTINNSVLDCVTTMLQQNDGIRIQKVNDRFFGGKYEVEGSNKPRRRVKKVCTQIRGDEKHYCLVITYTDDRDGDKEWVDLSSPRACHPAIGIVMAKQNIISPFLGSNIESRLRDANLRKVSAEKKLLDYRKAGVLAMDLQN